MEAGSDQRPQWQTDRVLDALIGQDIRVAGRSFVPTREGVQEPQRLIPARDLFLPDNRQPAGTPVYFEGRLRQFERRIGVVFVLLDSTASPARVSDGFVSFRGKTAVILGGPAMVELAYPFHVERLPGDASNYWRDLHVPQAQFEFPFSPDGDDGQGRSP